jgi:hypothetical protein
MLTVFCTATLGQDLPTPKKKAPLFATKETPPSSSTKLVQKYVFNVGTHTEFYNAVQIDPSGGVRKLDPAPVIGLGLHIPFQYELLFLPEFNWVLPRGGNDSKIIKNHFMLRADLGHTPVEWFRVRLGTSLMWLNQHGRGGPTNVNNGDDTSTFYYPDENRSSLNNTLDIGAEFFLDEWALRLQTYTYSLLREERRQLSYTLFVSYYWDR